MRRKGESILIYTEDIPENMTVAELFAGGPIKMTVTNTNDAQCKVAIDARMALRIARN